MFGTFSYLAPLLTDVAHLATGTVPLVLLVFGVGSFIGLTVGARFPDRNLLGNDRRAAHAARTAVVSAVPVEVGADGCVGCPA